MEPGSWDRFSLWEHQRNALDMARKYFTSNSRGAALVRMPTGTGKSGVIAVISQCFEEVKCVLVITPWVALRKQIANDIEKRFWDRIGVDPNQFNKKLVRFKPITLDLSFEREVTKIFVCTIQTLQILFNKYPEKYSELQRLISAVIVDEGHREPSPEWAKAIRNLQKPTILFTATPYRNDHKVFNVDPNHIFVYSHHEAVNDRIIREVVFKEEKIEQSPEAFVDSLLAFYHNEFQTLKPTDIDQPRVIVRCETSDEVKVIASLIKTKGESAIAIHERFSNSESAGSYKNVPNPDETDIIFWVHQLKLVEGIDNPSFCLLAIYQPFRNARMLVQQIGRIVRNPRLLDGQSAYVFSNSQYMQSAFWRGYCRYERDYESNPRKFEVRTIFEGYVNLQPEYLYFEGNYRRRFDANSDQAYQMFKYKKKCNVYEIANEFSLEELKKSLEDSWEKSDIDIRSISNPDKNTCIIGYISYMNSPLLISDCLLEFRVGYSIYRRVNNHLFFYDTHGMTPGYLIENSNKVEPNRLERLFSDKTTRLTLISLMNSDLGKHSIRRRVMQAYSIDETAPGLTDHIHFCSNALGYTATQDKEYIRRYVGFSRSRISDESEQTQGYEHYINWIDSIAHILDIGDKEKITTFERYAAFSDAPKDCTPISILFDIDDVITNYTTTNGENELVMDELCYNINSGEFRVLINDVTYIVEINFDREKKVYKLGSYMLENAFVKRDSNGKVTDNLIAYLNRSQSFRIIPKSEGYIYAHSRFYKPRLPLGGKTNQKKLELSRILHPLKVLDNIASEKGTGKPDGSGWTNDSVFNLIDTLGVGTNLENELRGLDILICDDMQSEIADFIGVDTNNKRVIFMHAKVNATRTVLSASSFHVVCSQAIKNLDYLNIYSDKLPPNIKLWNGAWKGGDLGVVRHRIRLGTGSASAIWGRIRSTLCDPTASREVLIFLGKGFSKSKFEQQQNKDNPEPEAVQAIYLLQSTWSAVSSIGAKLKIYCSP